MSVRLSNISNCIVVYVTKQALFCQMFRRKNTPEQCNAVLGGAAT